MNSADLWYKIMYLCNILLTISIVWFAYEVHITKQIFYGALEFYGEITPGWTWTGSGFVIDPNAPENFIIEPWVGDFIEPTS